LAWAPLSVGNTAGAIALDRGNRLRWLRSDFEDRAEIGRRAERGHPNQISIGIANKLSKRLPAVILALETIEHGFRPGRLSGCGRSELEHGAAADGPVDEIGAVAAASGDGRPIEVARDISDDSALRRCSIRYALEVMKDHITPHGSAWS